MNRTLKIAVVAGEESGELLAADLIRAVNRMTGQQVQLVGVGGRHLAELGLTSLFPSEDIALMGFSAIVRDLPRLISRIGSTAKAIAAEKPDCLVTVDSPEFNLRVAAKVRALAPSIPIVHYVCPSVWAWRPARAAAMRPHVDRVLCVLPFEVDELKRLGGPPGIFVGHRLTHEPGMLSAFKMQSARPPAAPDQEKTLLLLPGSRRGEVGSLMEPFRETVDILFQRGHKLRLLLPTVPNVESIVRDSVSAWPQRPEILTGSDEKWRAFGEADAALIASGTVSLELALSGVPMVSTYRLDGIARLFKGLVTTWSASLPNLIADRLVVQEFIDEAVRPGYLARQIEALIDDTPLRRWQKAGFDAVRTRMRTERPSGDIAGAAIIQLIKQHKT